MAERRLALVTGASAGIGAEYARFYAERGFDLAITARRADRLEGLANELEARHAGKVYPITADLADPAAPSRLLEAIDATGRHVDVLINNAGYGLPGTYVSTKWEEQAAFLSVLVTAPSELAHKVLPGMLSRGWGRIVNIASLAGIAPPSAGHTLYAAAKGYMIKFSQSLNAECEGKGVNVTAVCPGFTVTEFHDVNGMRETVSKMPDYMWQTARAVVEQGYDANERNQPVIVTGGVNKAVAAVSRILPDPLGNALMKAQAHRFRNAD
jgi:uncharacterized protein